MSKLSLVLPAVLVLAVAMAGSRPTPTQDDPASVSLVSKVLIGYAPKPAAISTAKSRAAAGTAFLASLDEVLRRQACFPLDDPERARWTNVPPGRDEGGVRLGDCDEGQLKKALDLLAATLSPQGYRKVRDILLADDRLLRNGQPRRGFGAVNYWLAVFGTPSETEAWGLQLDGHHVAVNLSFHGERMTLSPTFIGTQPSRYRLGEEVVVPMADEVGRAHDLIGSLAPEARAKAIVGPRRRGNVAGAGKDGFVPERVGVSCSELGPDARERLRALLSSVVGNLPEPAASQRMKKLEKEFDAMHLAWWGPIEEGSDMSYRVQGPTLIFEYAGQDLGGDPLDHLHSMYRDPTNEYGASLGE